MRSLLAGGLFIVAGWLAPGAAPGANAAQSAAGLVPIPEQFVTDVTQSEAALAVVQRSIDDTLLAGLRTFDGETAAGGLTDRFRGRFPEPGGGVIVDDGRLAIRRYTAVETEPLGREGFLALLRGHTAAWTAVERASWHAFEFLLEPAGDRAFVKAHLRLGGPDPGGARSVLDATVHASVIEAAPGRWRIDRLDVVRRRRSAIRGRPSATSPTRPVSTSTARTPTASCGRRSWIRGRASSTRD